jgi:hypothetical protein
MAPPKYWALSKLHVVTTQKTVLFIVTAMRTSDPTARSLVQTENAIRILSRQYDSRGETQINLLNIQGVRSNEAKIQMEPIYLISNFQIQPNPNQCNLFIQR